MTAPNDTAPQTGAPNATWRRCTFADIGKAELHDDDEGPRLLSVIDAYFAQFAAPIIPATAGLLMGARCRCGEVLTGLLGAFRYGLAHGEGHCVACGHPGRADHYVPDTDGSDLLTINRFPLLYFDTTPDAGGPA